MEARHEGRGDGGAGGDASAKVLEAFVRDCRLIRYVLSFKLR